VLQLVAHNFADPHFIVGPLDSLDYNVVPTSSDLVARDRGDGRVELVDVRQDSEAEQQGLRPGAEVLRIDGLLPQAAVAQVMGRPWAVLSPVQRTAGLTIALAGRYHRPRQLMLASSRAAPRSYTLCSPYEQARRLRAAPPARRAALKRDAARAGNRYSL
jgi:carboxyl-terminal processing protease